MKKLLAVLVVLGLSVPIFAQNLLPEHRFASGSWSFIGPRLYQGDARAPLAKVNVRIPQSGPMIYAFNARYESGAEDGHAGFGIHLFADAAHQGASWGTGKSYLLWLNYDENPRNASIPRGFSAQVYRSISHSRMELVHSIDLNQYSSLITPESLAQPLPIRLYMDGNTGEIRVYDPTDPSYYYFFYIDKGDVPIKGNWVALRTNGVKMSFALAN